MRYPVKQILMASAIAACTTLAACKGNQSNANQGNPNSMGADSAMAPGAPGGLDTTHTSTTSTGGAVRGADTTH